MIADAAPGDDPNRHPEAECSMSTARIRNVLRRAGITHIVERWGEIIVCQWEGRGHRWGHPGCGAYGYHDTRTEAWEGARIHLTGCDLRRTLEDRRESPDALVFSLVNFAAVTGWRVIDEDAPPARDTA